MSAHLIKLDWLSVEQSLLWIREEAGVQLSALDLLSHCESGSFALHLSVDGLEGQSLTGLINQDGEGFFKVFGAGKGLVINPRALIEAAGKDEIQLTILSEVCEERQQGADVYGYAEWVATVRPEDCHLLFKTQDIMAFVRSLAGAAASTARAKPSHLLTVAALLELLMDKGRPVYSQEDVIAEILDRHPAVRGLSLSGLQKMFAESNSAAVDAKMR